MIWLAYFIFFFMLLRLTISLTNLLTRQWLKKDHIDSQEIITSSLRSFPEPGHSPLLSLLIPARNEGKNIATLLNDLLYQDYDNFEILVYDDLSEDNTRQIVRYFAQKDTRIKLLEGGLLPVGWLGKNYACNQLVKKATGEYLLFLDADVRVNSSILRNSMIHMQRYNLDLFSLFPKQVMHTFGEKITVPVMNWVLVGLLPLILTRISSWSSFSAANGQFMLFRADVYRKYEFHKELKNIMVEDIEIFRLMKKRGLHTHTALSNGDITCRMYGSWGEAINGFSRNVIEYFGGHVPLAILFSLITTLGFIPVMLYLARQLSSAFFISLILHRITISYLSRQPVMQNLLFAPLQQFSFFIMIAAAIRHKTRHTLTWKGRDVYTGRT